jgi:hypothetical protein
MVYNDSFFSPAVLTVSKLFYVRFHVITAASMKMTAFWDIALCSLMALMTEAVRTSETSVYFETARCCIPESCHFRVILVRTADLYCDLVTVSTVLAVTLLESNAVTHRKRNIFLRVCCNFT